MTALLLALGLGFVSGLRTFTPVAAVMLVRGGIWGIVLAVAAVGEYVVDVLPNTPSRTQAMGLSARVISGACGDRRRDPGIRGLTDQWPLPG